VTSLFEIKNARENPLRNLNDMGKRGFNARVIQIESYVMNSIRSFGRKGWRWPTGVGYDAGWVWYDLVYLSH
jgi:hypothetical protein